MKKRGMFIFLFAILFAVFLMLSIISSSSSSSVDSEINKITAYAEDYEIGNINYAQLLIYLGSARQKLNELLGATEREQGGILKQEQLRSLLGEPTEETRWIWVEKEEREKKLDKPIPAWRKIIFDGKNIQIWINSWPSLFRKGQDEMVVYRLNLETRFKQAEDELNLNEKINNIKPLAEQYNANPSSENAEILAKESVNIERNFQMFMQQKQGKCEDIMASIFGSENKRAEQKMFVQEFDFYAGENFDVIAKLEMCDECEWNWISLDIRFDTRGKFRLPQESRYEKPPISGSIDFESEITSIISEMKSSLDEKDYNKFLSLKNRLMSYNEEWNKKSNDIWRDIEKMFEPEIKAAQEKQQEEYYWIKLEQRKREKEREIRKQNYEKRKQFYLSLFSSYEKKEFYFSQTEFEKRLVEIFREFGKEICNNNQDDNNNQKADCDDEQCGGKICGKQKVKTEKQEGNATIEEEIEKNLYCISGTCQLKEEIISERIEICGNHICEGNETESCIEDCVKCENYTAIECSGKVIFKGKDRNGCPLEPICLNETDSCEKNKDCAQPLCGKSECINQVCQTTKLEECKEAECAEGEEKIKNCENGDKIVFEKCIEGLWKKTGIDCPVENKTEISCEKECSNRIYPACVGHLEISGSYPDCNCNWICETSKKQCSIKEDCGNVDDVCSNGECVTLPKSEEKKPEQEIEQPEETPVETETQPQEIEQPEQEIQEQAETETQPETQEQITEQPAEQPQPAQETQQEQPVTAQVISAIKSITGKVTGLVVSITGFEAQEAQQQEQTQTTQDQVTTETPAEQQTPSTEQPQSETPKQETQEQPAEQPQPEEQPQPQEDRERIERQDRDRQEDREREDRENRETEGKERKENECRGMCEGECKGKLINPCVEKCVRESDCKDTSCVDEEIKKCESKCKSEKDMSKCVDECFGKCKKGEEFHQEREQEEMKMEKGVFKVGGACRSSQGKTEAFIWLDGWGEPFQDIQYLKQKYYSGGESEWCKQDLSSLEKQRKEFENSFNQEFVKWFFEKYLANSAEDWESQVSGIFELYWKNIDTIRESAHRMQCLGKKEISYSPIPKITYETEYGKLEFWEELKTAKIPGIDEETQVITPYMKVWVFPPKEFIVYEMKKAMKNHEFPGPPEDKMERKNEEGPTAEEKQMIKQDKKFMDNLKKIAGKYNGNLNAVIQFKDYEKSQEGEIVFNLYAQINEQDIIKVVPMLPEEVPEKDVTISIDFKKIYDIIYAQEKEMRGEYIESPPWDRKINPIGKIKEVTNGIKIYFKARSMINSAEISPKESEKDVKSMINYFFSMMMKKGMGEKPEPEEKGIGEEKGVWEDKEKITGEVVKSA